ncbi:signal peptide-containing protein [Cryptosporidium canis]|uniref:Signal peptide-containing protein n=1 Tax=Cryptosporidium canis TaxID=195482 RepID=A0A9D5HWN0_9CRYT|nr:signal peptide-containing protein [Cryptosporidium canis]
MNLSSSTLIILACILLIHQALDDHLFVSAISQGEVGYYDSNQADSKIGKPSMKFRKSLESIKKSFLQLFISDSREFMNVTSTQFPRNTPFMDYFHRSVIKKIIPKSEEVCSSIQLMSFWRLYYDVLNLVELEMFSHLDSSQIRGKIPKHSQQESEIDSQSLEINRDISEEIKVVKFDYNLTLRNVHHANNTSLTNKTVSPLAPEKKKTKSRKGRARNAKIKRKKKLAPTFDYGLHRYYYLE